MILASFNNVTDRYALSSNLAKGKKKKKEKELVNSTQKHFKMLNEESDGPFRHTQIC